MKKIRSSHKVTLCFCLVYLAAATALLAKEEFLWSSALILIGVVHFLIVYAIFFSPKKEE
ncbi:MAG: hypothetical protein A2534_02820 [Candidatus Magasanikbacteria bacterium RIFOXYD2_FULL_39_9]|nr:MAG: hypothetical protein A2534_02820 [Candidatus Magasanikbacteria bacterium RIFOXYD2_FULL_39_9]